MNLAVLAGQAGSQNAGGSIMTMVILYAVIIGSLQSVHRANRRKSMRTYSVR